MRRRKRLRKKLHRKFLTTVCAYVVTFDDDLRRRLLASEPGTPLRIGSGCSRGIGRLMRRWGLSYWVAVARKLSPVDAVVIFWAEEFLVVQDEAFIFSLEGSA